MPPLEETHLLGPRPAKLRRIEPVSLLCVQPELAAGELEAVADEPRESALSRHARAKFRIVVAPAAHLADARHDVLRLKRIVPLEPVLEQRLHLPRQAQDRV